MRLCSKLLAAEVELALHVLRHMDSQHELAEPPHWPRISMTEVGQIARLTAKSPEFWEFLLSLS